jgi:hypothetical protein
MAVALAGCAVKTPNDPVVCTAIAVSSLIVTVRDASTGARLCDAAVIAIHEGRTTQALERVGDCAWAGPWEVPGEFEVVVTRTGYEARRVTGIRVTADECHVIPVQLSVDLRPAG